MKHERISFESCPLVILCGGKGIRLKSKAKSIPKPLLKIGSIPIILHVMDIYASQGFKKFILCLGYKGEQIKFFFQKLLKKHPFKDWQIDFAYTGVDTPTGGRIKLIEPLIKSEHFMVTYADGLAQINIKKLLKCHLKHKKIGTVTCVHPISYFGELELSKNCLVKKFKEKPKLKSWINGGFFVFKHSIFNFLKITDTLEKEPVLKMIKKKQLVGYKHLKFWKCMDTYKDLNELNYIWKMRKVPWKK